MGRDKAEPAEGLRHPGASGTVSLLKDTRLLEAALGGVEVAAAEGNVTAACELLHGLRDTLLLWHSRGRETRVEHGGQFVVGEWVGVRHRRRSLCLSGLQPTSRGHPTGVSTGCTAHGAALCRLESA